MIDTEKFNELFDFVLKNSNADQTEVVIFSHDRGLTRYTGNSIHQNVKTTDTYLTLRTVVGKKVLVSATNNLANQDLRDFINNAVSATKLQKEDENFVSLPVSDREFEVSLVDEKTAEFGALQRAELLSEVIKRAKSSGISCAGILANRKEGIGVANSLGNRGIFRHTMAHLSLTATKSGTSGWAECYSRKIDDLDMDKVAGKAFQISGIPPTPVDIEPGRYTVILEEYPFASLLGYLSWIAFGAKAYLEGRSYISGKLGQRITNSNVSLFDDCSHPLFQGLPFDLEGMPRKKLALIENGVASDIAFDSYTAGKANKNNNGHAGMVSNIEGPHPADLVFLPGEYSREEIIGSTKRGILITRLWYIRVVDYKRTILTGMTRDGTFLIEDGKIAGSIKNFRFNQSIIETLNNISMVGKELKPQYEMGVKAVNPMVKIENFNFTGKTLF